MRLLSRAAHAPLGGPHMCGPGRAACGPADRGACATVHFSLSQMRHGHSALTDAHGPLSLLQMRTVPIADAHVAIARTDATSGP